MSAEPERELGPVAERLGPLRWLLALAFFGVGLLGIDPGSWRWSALGLTLFGLPLALQLLPSVALRWAGLWIGAFLLLQALLVPLLEAAGRSGPDYGALPPHMDEVLEIRPGVLPGLQGSQQISTDALGFRVTRPVDYADPSRKRIFAIGGSTTEQLHLDDHDTWTHLLQEALREQHELDVEVVNTGVSGTRARHHLAMLRRVRRLAPDLVIISSGINDWNWQIAHYFENGSREWEQFETGRNFLRLRNGLLGRALRRRQAGRDNGAFAPERTDRRLTLVRHNPQRNSLARPDRRHYRPAAVSPEFDYFLGEMAALCRDADLPCLFLTQPTAYDSRIPPSLRNHLWMTPPSQPYTLDLDSMGHIAELYNRHLLDFAKGAQQPVHDLAAQLPPTPDSFYDDCHFNMAGARRVAELLAPRVAGLLMAIGD